MSHVIPKCRVCQNSYASDLSCNVCRKAKAQMAMPDAILTAERTIQRASTMAAAALAKIEATMFDPGKPISKEQAQTFEIVSRAARALSAETRQLGKLGDGEAYTADQKDQYVLDYIATRPDRVIRKTVKSLQDLLNSRSRTDGQPA